MPIIHIVATVLSVVVFIQTAARLRKPTVPTWRDATLAALAALMAFLAGVWLFDAHPEASFAFRAGIYIQLACGVGIVILSLFHVASRRRT
jgi:Co/Zn/Cd efflux system component